jgi:uncharacterized protein (DUF779 family)
MTYANLKTKAERAYVRLGGMGNVNARVVRALVEQCDKYRDHIDRMGNTHGECTFHALGKVCDGCRCERRPSL